MKQWLLRFFQLSAILVALLSVAGLWGKLHYLLEMTVHFKWQYLVSSAAIAVFFALTQRQIWLGLSLCVVLFNLSFLVPWYLPDQRFLPQSAAGDIRASNQMPLKLLLANINVANRNYATTLDFIQSTDPDIFVIVETNKQWLERLNQVTSLPYSIQSPNAGNFGIALYSKFPLNPIDIPTLPASTVSSVEDYHVAATIEINQTPVNLIAIHPPPPRTSTLTALRDRELKIIGDFVQDNPSPTVVLGDFNTTMWTSAYQQFEQQTQLRNARQGFGILPTWTTEFPLLFIPIDHGLISSEFRVLDIKTGENLGSDHLPLIIELAPT